MKIPIFTFLLIHILFGFPPNWVQETKPSGNSNVKSLVRNLDQLLVKNPDDFYRKAISIRTNEIQDKDAAYDLYRLFSSYYQSIIDYDSMILSLHKAKAVLGNKNSEKLAPVFLDLAYAFKEKGNVDSLNFYLDMAAVHIDENSVYYGEYLLIDGLKSAYNADYLFAIEKLIESSQYFDAQGDKKRLAMAYNNLAYNFKKIGDYESQFIYLTKAVTINREINNVQDLVMNYNNLGTYFNSQNLLDSALVYYDLSFKEAKDLNNLSLIAQNITNRANIYEKKGDLKRAEQLFLECYNICVKKNIVYGRMLSAINLGNLYRQQRRFLLANKRLNEAEELSKALKTKKEEALVYERRAWLERDRGNYQVAFEAQAKFFSLNDSIINESVKKEASQLREKYETEKKENQIISLSKEKLYHQFALVLISLGCLTLLLIIQWWRNKWKLTEKEKQTELLKRDHLKTLILNKDQELRTQANQLLQINNQLEAAKMKISNVMHESSEDHFRIKKIDGILTGKRFKNIKTDFDSRVASSNEEFFNKLLNLYPELSPSELKLCAYLRLNLTTKDIAEIINRSVRTVETTRTNIRKKMSLEAQDNLVSHLMSFFIK
jgi:tetratricopeptide (TPR) repeat protein